MLHKSEQPDCPKCGCNASAYLGRREFAGWARDHYRCTFCGKKHAVPLGKIKEQAEAEAAEDDDEHGASYYKLCCKGCGSFKVRVSHTQGRVRFVKCDACGRNRKTTQVDVPV